MQATFIGTAKPPYKPSPLELLLLQSSSNVLENRLRNDSVTRASAISHLKKFNMQYVACKVGMICTLITDENRNDLVNWALQNPDTMFAKGLGTNTNIIRDGKDKNIQSLDGFMVERKSTKFARALQKNRWYGIKKKK